jgi:hypothetical protein
MSWKDILKYCEWHRNEPDPIPAKEEKKMATTVTTTSSPSLFNTRYSNPKEKEDEEDGKGN